MKKPHQYKTTIQGHEEGIFCKRYIFSLNRTIQSTHSPQFTFLVKSVEVPENKSQGMVSSVQLYTNSTPKKAVWWDLLWGRVFFCFFTKISCGGREHRDLRRLLSWGLPAQPRSRADALPGLAASVSSDPLLWLRRGQVLTPTHIPKQFGIPARLCNTHS